MNDRVSSVFDAFVEAKNALERVPQLERDLATRDSQIEYLNRDREELSRRSDNQSASIADLMSRIATLEASLDAATKSGEAQATKLQMLLDVVREISSNANTVAEVVDPPKPVPVAEPVQQAVQNEPVARAEPMMDDDEIIYDVRRPLGSNTSEPVSSSEGSDKPWNTPRTPYEAKRRADGLDWYDMTNTKHEGQSATNPTAAPSVDTSLTSPSTDALTSGVEPSTSVSVDKPYTDRPHWHKPESMSREEWVAKGGEAAPWWGMTNVV